ncbi:MAG: phosphatidylglycerophosphatase A [Ardenticatenales bacterium]
MTERPPAAPSPTRSARLALAVGTLGGLGRVPIAPGTAASLAAVLVAAALPAGSYSVLVLALFLVASAAAPVAARAMTAATGDEDPRSFVLDEAAGVWLAALRPAQPSWAAFVGIFVLFRVFDVWKPWPIRRFERIGRGWGVLLDDLAAGVATAAVLFFLEALLR